MSRRRNAQETRAIIFEAASKILRNEGLSSLTIAKVASEAGLSKGGLLYHFPNKLSLIEALFNYHNNRFEQRLEQLTLQEGNQPGSWLRAYAKASLEQVLDQDTASLYFALFAAEEKYASAHKLMRQKYQVWQQTLIANSDDVTWATVLRLAIDGLWFTEMHHYAPLPEAQRQAVIDIILRLTKQPKPT